jgi:hypothetical protein
MIKLVKSVFEYHKISMIIAYSFVILLNFVMIVSGDWYEIQDDIPGMRVVWFLPISIVAIIFITRFNIQSRNRFLGILPIKTFKIALLKLSVGLIFWFTILALHFIVYLIMMSKFPSAEWIYDNLSYTGLIIIFSSIPLVYSDLLSYSSKPLHKFILSSMWTIIMISLMSYFLLSLPYLAHMSPEFISATSEALKNFYFSVNGSITLLAIGLFIAAADILIYQKRKSYL